MHKRMTVKPIDGQIEVSSEGIRPYRLVGNWRVILLEWQNAGWDISWTA
jgi:hypothetical protein